jgi:GrpB-like predicted nucleotidyltransferase (UPF0157 family)
VGRRIKVVPYDPAWPAQFEKEAEELRGIFGPALVSIHHIGSTSVPGLSAKPVIDILAVLRKGSDQTGFDESLTALGYRVRGECLDRGGTPGRFYFSKPVEGERTHHLHVCIEGHFQVAELILLPEYLRENAEVAAEYARLKIEAAEDHADDNVGYMARKHAWIRATIQEAMAESSVQGPLHQLEGEGTVASQRDVATDP